MGILYDKLEEIWFKLFGIENVRHLDDAHIKARYVGTRDGVFIPFPGKRLPQHYDHTTQPWYEHW